MTAELMTATPRRTQAERRASSGARILDAALQSLAERGYAGTTIPEVLRRAGLTNGAMWRHFRTKADLLAAASLHADEKFAEAHRSGPPADTSRPPGERLDAAVATLWEFSQGVSFQASLELLRASRSDPELRDALRGVDSRVGELVFTTFARLVGPDLEGHPRFARNVRQIGLVMYGAALTQGVRGESGGLLLLAETQELARELFGVPGQPVAPVRELGSAPV